MKKIVSFIAIIASAISVHAQKEDYVQWGPEVGGGMSTITQKVDGKNYLNEFVPFAKVGLTFDIPVDQLFFIQPAIHFSYMNGGKTSHKEYYSAGVGIPTTIEDARSYRLYSFDIPVYFTLKTRHVYHDNRWAIGVGPVVTFNAKGHYESEYATSINGERRPVSQDRPIYIGSDRGAHDIKLLNLGVSAMLGFEMSNGFNIRANYGFGLTNISPGANENNIMRSQGGSICLSYYFNKFRY